MSTYNNFLTNYISGSDITVSFSSSYSIYETQYKCTIGIDNIIIQIIPL